MDVKGVLSLPDSTLLQWKEEDTGGNQEALRLGASLQSAAEMHMELQNTYKHEK